MKNTIEMHADDQNVYVTIPPKMAKSFSRHSKGGSIFASTELEDGDGFELFFSVGGPPITSFESVECTFQWMERMWLEVTIPRAGNLIELPNFDPITLDKFRLFDSNTTITILIEDLRASLKKVNYPTYRKDVDTKAQLKPTSVEVTSVEPQRHNGGWMRWDGSIISKEIALLQSAMCINSYIDAGEAEVFIKDGRIVVASKTLKYL